MIRFACPKCKQVLQVQDEHAGRVVACPGCRQPLKAPALPPVAAPVPAPEVPIDIGQYAIPDAPAPPPPPAAPPANPFADLDSSAPAPTEEYSLSELANALPGDVPEEVTRLGKPVAMYSAKAHTVAWQQGREVGLPAAIGGAVLLVIGVVTLVIGIARGSANVGSVACFAFPVGLGVGAYGLSRLLSAGKERSRYAGMRVVVCEHGFVCIQGKTVTAFPWDEVKAVWQQITRHLLQTQWGTRDLGTNYRYTVERKDGEMVELNEAIRGVKALAEVINAEVGKRLLPKYLDRYYAGKRVHFGDVAVCEEGLEHDKELLPWNKVHNLEFESGYMKIYRFGTNQPWLVLPAHDVPNLPVFEKMVRGILNQPGW